MFILKVAEVAEGSKGERPAGEGNVRCERIWKRREL